MSNYSSPQNYIKNDITQNFSIPSVIISYILQKDNKLLLQKPQEFIYKINSLCKYFFATLRVVPCYHLSTESNHLILKNSGAVPNSATISFQRLQTTKQYFSPKTFGTDLMFNFYPDSIGRTPPKNVSLILPRICNNRIIYVSLRNQELTLEEYLFLIAKNKCEIILYDCKISNGKHSIMPAEELLEVSPNLIQFSLYCDENSDLNYCTLLTAQKLASFPTFKDLLFFNLANVPKNFCVLNFIEFIKKTSKDKPVTTFDINFKNNVSPIFIQNFIRTVDAAVITMKSAEQKIYFKVW